MSVCVWIVRAREKDKHANIISIHLKCKPNKKKNKQMTQKTESQVWMNHLGKIEIFFIIWKWLQFDDLMADELR